jgi:transposase-like protein
VTDGAGEGTRHLPVFHCPYCGEEDLLPYEGTSGSSSPAASPSGWRCGACLRAFSVRLIATGVQR